MPYEDDPDYQRVNRKKRAYFIAHAIPRASFYVSEFISGVSLAYELAEVLRTMGTLYDPEHPYEPHPPFDYSVFDAATPLTFFGLGTLFFLAYKVWLRPKYEEFKKLEEIIVEVYKKSELEKGLKKS